VVAILGHVVQTACEVKVQSIGVRAAAYSGHFVYNTIAWDVGKSGYSLSTQVSYLCAVKFYSFVLIVCRIAEIHHNLLACVEYLNHLLHYFVN